MKENISYLLYRYGWLLIGALPESISYRLFDVIASKMYSRNGKSVHRLRVNFETVLSHKGISLSESDLEDLVLRGIKSYMRYWCDTFRIHTWSAERIKSTVTCTNDELLRDPMNDGRGVVIALPHSGNWDHAGAYFCNEGYPLVTVAEVLKPRKLFEKFLQFRQSMGFEVLPLESRTFITLIKRAREKRLIALVSDRDLSSSGIEVDFFGAVAKMPAGPALLAIRENIPLVAAHVAYTQEGIHITFTQIEISQSKDEEVRISQTVQNMAYAFADGISEDLVDWHMLQKIWISEGFYR